MLPCMVLSPSVEQQPCFVLLYSLIDFFLYQIDFFLKLERGDLALTEFQIIT